WNFTMGKIFQSILEKERRGDFLGKTVQFIPHVTDEIKNRIYKIAKDEKSDIVLIEIGGTVGDLENGLYLEAIRQLAYENGKDNVMFIHLSYVPIPFGVNEQKSKPTQMSVKLLNEIGLQPDVIVARCEEYLSENIKRKISMFCNLPVENVITGKDVNSVYLIPGELKKQNLDKLIENKLRIKLKPDIKKWDELANKLSNLKNNSKKVTIGICGKYTALGDSYASVVEAIRHSAVNLNTDVEIKMIDTENIKSLDDAKKSLIGINGVIVPGGFGNRGWEGKIKIIEYVRINNIPFLGICLGFQAAVIEYARNVCGLDANSTEMDENVKDKIITLMDSQKNIVSKGGSMRLGNYCAILDEGVISKLYNSSNVNERHRHRYEVNPEYHKLIEEKGLKFVGKSNDGKLAEFLELPSHKYFVGTQAHPELKSNLENPSPLFYGLIKACLEE
ncbi:MAG: CTP synthase (glutamine hydrolyzing), partial [Candidatus ainarchaeum sp.]|nr:CTP synthase (glutamine hydrolyzing) [Candidatus ainarchaeum sp.]